MNAPELSPQVAPRDERLPESPRLRNTIRKSALLNVTVILTSFPVLVFAGGAQSLVPCLAIMAGISLLIWSVTFALFSFVSLFGVFFMPAAGKPRKRTQQVTGEGLSDRWLDESV